MLKRKKNGQSETLGDEVKKGLQGPKSQENAEMPGHEQKKKRPKFITENSSKIRNSFV